MNKSGVKLIAAISAFALLAAHARAALNDATVDFQTVRNPSTVWSYGYSSAGGAAYALILFDDHAGFNAWTKSNYIFLGAPVAWKNTTGRTQDGVAPGQISLHPGPLDGGDFAILRFTAPTTATYDVTGQFFGGDSGSMSGSVLRNGDFTHPLQSFSNTTDTSYFNLAHISLRAGQTLDFVVGNNGSFFSGNTPLAVVIVPEPQIYAMFLTGIGLLGLAARRRNSNARDRCRPTTPGPRPIARCSPRDGPAR